MNAVVHVEVLDPTEALVLFEQISSEGTAPLPRQVADLVPGAEGHRVLPCPALESAGPVSGARAVMVLGAARTVTSPTSTYELVPGDVLETGSDATLTVQPSGDDLDAAVLFVLV